MDDRTYFKLTHAVTEYDRRESRKRYYNPYALPLYLGAAQNVREDVESGSTLREAIMTRFNGRLCAFVMRQVGESPLTESEHMRIR